MSSPVLVYGWYGRRNAGDELMKLALERLLRAHGLEPKFVDTIDDGALEGMAGCIFGGGSILVDDPVITPTAIETLATLRVPPFYVGVGGETSISPIHQRLIDASPVVAFRELDTPDLAYYFASDVGPANREPEGVLVVPNVEVLPVHSDPHWMHESWEHFKNEFAQVLDRIVERHHKLSFVTFCDADKKKDIWVTHELMGRMSQRDSYPIHVADANDPLQIATLMRSFKVVVTQRYHGIILAEMAGVPYVSISHHDKLRLTHPHRGSNASYFGVQKDPLWDLIEGAMSSHIDPHTPPHSVYDDVIGRIAAVVKEPK